ncbi:SDR family oxidoreductase [Georgenia yuyongxinii]|uniref:SDR family oxidoreductase n=1 Tax=Georgenia yuyongxinii TaxID=2589797 RepID=A0A552WU44_9MICO|nr:SDR family oxidoreductase [Georgenia yuyongxinii]TRW46277.1 SDR family oxidoreductase [Georgenia yuyongxinii]
MRVVIAGGHGKIARILERQLATRGDEVVGLIRNPDHSADLTDVSAEPVVFDLERQSAAELAPILRGADAVVFAAGAGPGSGAARKDTVDRAAAALLADAAEMAGVRRYVMVSAMGAATGSAPGHEEVFAAYLDAKKAADEDLMARDLDWTIIRPGGLTDEPGTGTVTMARETGHGPVPREDVARVICAALDDPATIGLVAEVITGPTRVAVALAELTD